jgi:hypothetical protein
VYLRVGPSTSRYEGYRLSRGSRDYPWSVREFFLRSLLVNAAKRRHESRIGRLSAATQDGRVAPGSDPSDIAGLAKKEALRARGQLRTLFGREASD